MDDCNDYSLNISHENSSDFLTIISAIKRDLDEMVSCFEKSVTKRSAIGERDIFINSRDSVLSGLSNLSKIWTTKTLVNNSIVTPGILAISNEECNDIIDSVEDIRKSLHSRFDDLETRLNYYFKDNLTQISHYIDDKFSLPQMTDPALRDPVTDTVGNCSNPSPSATRRSTVLPDTASIVPHSDPTVNLPPSAVLTLSHIPTEVPHPSLSFDHPPTVTPAGLSSSCITPAGPSTIKRGTASTGKLKAVSSSGSAGGKFRRLLISKLDCGTVIQDVAAFVSEYVADFEILHIHTRNLNIYNSYVVTVGESDFAKLDNPNIWPSGLSFREFFGRPKWIIDSCTAGSFISRKPPGQTSS